ncbi:MAG: hypothetical protein FVQ82_14800 [Planctomycetes bacterium]|nr:hypothetical protein [Planctomycetota bacterium]
MANKYSLCILLSVLTAILSGCGMNIAIIDNVVIPDADFTAARSLKLMDPEGPIFIKEIVTTDGFNTYEYSSNRVPVIDMPDIATADFHLDEYDRNHYMVVKGKMTCGKTYPVILDTGANLDALIVQDIHIRQNDLPVYPLTKSSGPESKMSLCAVEQLTLGDFKLRDYTGVSWGQHVELKLLGLIPLGRSTDICFSLPLMSKFKYFKFDTPARQVQFSAKKSFKPQSEENWHRFPLTIEYLNNDRSKQRLFINLEVNGIPIRPLLDTGAGLGLMMNNRLWERVKDNFEETGRSKFHFILPYHFEGNKPRCVGIKVKDLSLGDMSIKNAEITVLPETKNWKKTDCIMGMGYFREKTVVLDFEKKTLWVNK